MTDYEDSLASYRSQVLELEARARQLREGSSAFDPESAVREADELNEQAAALRRALAEILRLNFGVDDDDEDERRQKAERRY